MTDSSRHSPRPPTASAATMVANKPASKATPETVEIGGPKGPEPTRYGDWERAGKCVDF